MGLFNGDPLPPIAQTPSAPAAPAPLAPVTSMPSFPAPVPAPGMFARIKKTVSDNLFATPSGLGDAVTPDEQKAARAQGLLSLGIALSQGHGENPLQSLGRGLQAAQQGYQGALQDTVHQKEAAIQMQQQQAAQQRIKQHAQLAQQFAPQPNETTDQSISRLSSYATAMAAFDPESAAKISDTVSKLRTPNPTPTVIDLGSHKLLTDHTGKVLRDDAVTETPAQAARANQIAANAGKADARAEATATRDERRQENVVVHDFDSNKVVKDFHAAEAAYSVLNAARTGKPGAFTAMSALDGFARELNPQGAVRVGTLQILKDQGSAGERMARAYEMFKSGQWSKKLLDDVLNQGEEIMRQHGEDFDHFREETMSRAEAQGLDRAKFDKILYHRRQLAAPSKVQSTGKLGSY